MKHYSPIKRALVGALFALTGLTTLQVPAAAPDLSGYWQVTRATSLASPTAMQPLDGKPIPLQPWSYALYRGGAYFNRTLKDPWPANNQRCLMAGTVRAMKGNFPWRLIQDDQQITVLLEEEGRINIFPFRNEHRADAKQTWNGDSIAYWDNDVLVVDVTHFNGKTPFPHAIMHTDLLHVMHRFRLINDGKQLEDRILIDDLGAFTRTFEVNTVFDRKPDNYQLRDYRCAENIRDLPEPISWWGVDWGPE